MSMRRRRKKLSTVVNTLDRRLRSVELKKPIFSKAGLSASVDDEVDTTLPEGTLYEGDAPNAWHRITGAYYYPAKVIGSGDRAEIFLAASDPGLDAERGETISISRLESSAGQVTIVTTDSDPEYYTVRAHGTPNWSLTTTNTRQSKKSNTGTQIYFPLADTGSGVGHTYLFSPESDSTYSFPPSTLRYSLKFRALLDKHSATTTTATLTFNSTHHYEPGDIIEVMDLPAGYRGIDGIFEVRTTTSNTLTYDFDNNLTAVIPEATASPNVYVYSVAQKYVRVGSTYINSTDGTVYYWDGIRYTRSAPAGLSNDGNAPSPPTNLTLTTSGYSLADGSARSRVDLTWTAPTTSAGGGELDDLAGYRIFISQTGFSDWTQKITYEKAVTAQTITNLDQNKEYYFRVIAFDSFGLDSTGLDDSIITGVAALSVTTPSAPVIPTVRFGVVTVKWDGEDSAGAVIPSRLLDHVEVHASTSSGFTPSTSTLVGKIFSASDSCYVTDLDYNTTYYFKFVAKDKSGNLTTASTQTSAVVKPLVDTDLIAAQLNSPLSVWPFANAAVTPGALASGAINASNIFGENVIVQSAIAANAIGANQIAAGQVTAGKIGANAIVAANIQALQINAGLINANAIETDKINAGAITGVKIAARAITGDKVLATTSITFADSQDGNGNPASGSSQVVIGTHQVPGYPVTFTGISFLRSGDFKGIIGTSADWADFIVGLDYSTNSLQWFYSSDIQANSAYLRATGDITLSNYGSNRISFYSGGDLVLSSASNTIKANSRILMALGTVDDGLWGTSTGGTPRLLITPAGSMYPTTGSGLSTPVHQNATGSILTRNTSSRRYKVLEEPLDTGLSILDLQPKTWVDKGEYEANGSSVEGLRRYPGFIAEDLDDAGFAMFVHHNEDGSAESIHYAQMVAAIVPVLKNYQSRISELESTIDEMKKA